MIISTLFLISFTIKADWFCTESISQKRGNTYLVCGVGVDVDEHVAREKSTQAAFKEFDLLCQRDQSCSKYETSVEPKRSECQKLNGSYECKRLFEISLTREERPAPLINSNGDEPRTTSPVYIGQSKQDLIANFGIPFQVLNAGHDGSDLKQIFMFRSAVFCLSQFCSVVVSSDAVERYSDFKPEFTDVLATKKKSLIDKFRDLFR
ncbi:MAG: hypothetical protein K2Q26_03955 [Bdellovibrionales bacterium]|nr:hypothetical protein [Bdellovibrionales bacterium]